MCQMIKGINYISRVIEKRIGLKRWWPCWSNERVRFWPAYVLSFCVRNRLCTRRSFDQTKIPSHLIIALLYRNYTGTTQCRINQRSRIEISAQIQHVVCGRLMRSLSKWPCGEMASRLTTTQRESGDCRFDPCLGHFFSYHNQFAILQVWRSFRLQAPYNSIIYLSIFVKRSSKPIVNPFARHNSSGVVLTYTAQFARDRLFVACLLPRCMISAQTWLLSFFFSYYHLNGRDYSRNSAQPCGRYAAHARLPAGDARREFAPQHYHSARHRVWQDTHRRPPHEARDGKADDKGTYRLPFIVKANVLMLCNTHGSSPQLSLSANSRWM